MTRARLLIALLLAACSKDAPVDKTEAAKPSIKAHEKAHATVTTARAKPAQLTQVTIKALGMYCEESCPLKVRTALAEIPAVYELGFDVSKESIFVSYDASLGTAKDVTKPMLVAIKSAGFDPWLAKETWPDGASVQVVQN